MCVTSWFTGAVNCDGFDIALLVPHIFIYILSVRCVVI